MICPTCGADRLKEPCKRPENCPMVGTAHTNQTDSSATSGGGSGHDPQCYKRGGSCGCGGGCCGKYDRAPAPQAATPSPGGQDERANRAIDFDKLAVLMAHYLAGNVPGDLYWRVDVTAEVLRRAVAVTRSSLTLQAAPEAPVYQIKSFIYPQGWHDTDQQTYEDLKANGQAVRIVYASPVAAPEAPALPHMPPVEQLVRMLDTAERGFQCPMCGLNYPHRHTPNEIIIFRNGAKYAARSQEYARVNNQGAAQDGADDTGGACAGSGIGANERHEHRARKSDADRCDGGEDGGSDGVSNRGEVREALAAPEVPADERRNIAEVQRTSDMGLSIRFMSARACSAFERYLTSTVAAPEAPTDPTMAMLAAMVGNARDRGVRMTEVDAKAIYAAARRASSPAATTASASGEKCATCAGTHWIDDPHDIEHGQIRCPECADRAPTPSREAAPQIKTWQERYAGLSATLNTPPNEVRAERRKSACRDAEIADLRAALAQQGTPQAPASEKGEGRGE